MRDAASIPTNNSGDMGPDNLSQLLRVCDRLDPARQLRMPDQSMTSDELAVVGSPVGQVISRAPVVRSLSALKRAPFHRVLAGHLAKVGLDDGGISITLQKSLVSGSAEVFFAGGDEGLMDRGGGLAVVERVGGQSCHKGCAEQGGERLHIEK